MAIVVHTMGVPAWWVMPDVLTTQIRLAHELREDLVTLQLEYEEAVRAVWSGYPAVAAAESALATAEAEAAAAAEAVAAERSRQRTKRVTGPVADRLRTARSTVKAARQQRRDAITAVRDDATERLQAARDTLRAAQKDLYQQYCSDGGRGLFWASFNDVVDHHKAAVQRVQQRRAQGRPAALKQHRFDGTGTIAVQLQRPKGMPLRTPATIADPAGPWRNVLALPWIAPDVWAPMSRGERRRAGRIDVRMRCGSIDGASQWITVPVQAHRWLPADADITGARLSVTRTAGHLKARLTVTARVRDPEPATTGPTVAIHLGWMATDRGTRVATWRADSPVTIPPHLRDVITSDREAMTGEVIMPMSIGIRLDRYAETASARSLSLDGVRQKLVAWLAEHGPAPYGGDDITDADVARWRSPARFAALANAWRNTPPPGGREITCVLETWRRADRRLWESSEHGRRRAQRHRDDLYRQVAATISAAASQVVVDDTDVAALAYAAVDRSDLPSDQQRGIDRRRDHAAPGTLRQAVVAAAIRDGVPVTTVAAAGLSRIHARCQHENPTDDRYLSRPVLCDGCGATYDPDASATLIMLQRAVRPDQPSQ